MMMTNLFLFTSGVQIHVIGVSQDKKMVGQSSRPLVVLFRLASLSSQLYAFYWMHLTGTLTLEIISKMFTLWTGVVLIIYLLFALLNDLFVKSPPKKLFDRFVSLNFHLALIMSVATVSLFWSIYALDPENMIPKNFYYPPVLNHLQHTVPGVIVLSELLLVRSPEGTLNSYWGSKFVAVCLTPIAYLSFTALKFKIQGTWPYPFMSSWTFVEFGVFYVAASLLALLFHYIIYWFVKSFLAGNKATASTKLE